MLSAESGAARPGRRQREELVHYPPGKVHLGKGKQLLGQNLLSENKYSC